MEFVVYILVFAAVPLVVYSFAQMGQGFVQEKAEIAARTREQQSFTSPVNRFVSDQRLNQLRVMAGIICGAGLVGMMIFGGLLNPLAWLPGGAIAGAAGYMAPMWWFKMKVRKRKDVFEAQILDLAMGLESGLRSGQALPQALESIVRRMEGPVQEEMLVVLREYRLGLELADALDRLHQRMPCEDLNLLVTSIKLTTRTGGSMAEVLTRMVSMIRGRTEFQEKLKTLTAQGRFEAMALSAAPFAAFVILYLLNPDLMRPMLSHPVGWMAFGVVLGLVGIGYFIVKKIVTIEV